MPSRSAGLFLNSRACPSLSHRPISRHLLRPRASSRGSQRLSCLPWLTPKSKRPRINPRMESLRKRRRRRKLSQRMRRPRHLRKWLRRRSTAECQARGILAILLIIIGIQLLVIPMDMAATVWVAMEDMGMVPVTAAITQWPMATPMGAMELASLATSPQSQPIMMS